MDNNFKIKMFELSKNINVNISEEQIEKFYVKEVQLKADKVRLCLQCESLW